MTHSFNYGVSPRDAPQHDLGPEGLQEGLRLIQQSVNQLSEELAKMQLRSSAAPQPPAPAFPTPPTLIPATPTTTDGPKRQAWYVVYVGLTVGPIQGGDRVTIATSGVRHSRKEECLSEEDAIARFHQALVTTPPSVYRVIPERRDVLCWEDVFPGIARPIAPKK